MRGVKAILAAGLALGMVTTLSTTMVLLPAVAWGQQPGPDAERAGTAPAGREEPERLEGFWPTRRMTEYTLHRWCEQVIRDYELDDVQAAQLQETMFRRWPAWMERHRQELQPVMNEFMERKIAPGPPDAQRVRDWSERALRIFDAGRNELQEVQGEFRQTLRPGQKMKFDADLTKVNIGLELLERRLTAWRDGYYEPQELWDRPDYMAERSAEEERVAEGSGQPGETESVDRAAVRLDDWEKYVRVFIARYQLDDAQVTSAFSILEDVRTRAASYRLRRAEDYARLETRLQDAGARRREGLLVQQAELDQPVVKLFEELKTRLERLLTSAQRTTAETASSS